MPGLKSQAPQLPRTAAGHIQIRGENQMLETVKHHLKPD
jgi:hypothetical protein